MGYKMLVCIDPKDNTIFERYLSIADACKYNEDYDSEELLQAAMYYSNYKGYYWKFI